MIDGEISFTCRDRSRIAVACRQLDAGEAVLQVGLVHESLRVRATDRFETAALTALWSDLGVAGDGGSAWTGRDGRVSLRLRWSDSVLGIRLELRPAEGLRIELETAAVDERAAWREVLAAWLRDCDPTRHDREFWSE